MAQTITNKFKALNANGTIVLGTSTLKMGGINGAGGQTLSGNFAAALDPDVNFVSDLLAIVTEITGGSYARQTLASVTVTEDDANNRANVDSANVTFTAVASGQHLIGVWIEAPGGSDAARPVVGVYEVTEVPGNGSDITVTISDFARLS